MIIRDATEADLPAIVAIYNSTVPSRIVTADVEPVSVESRLAWFHAHSPDRYPLWVMEIDGAVAGWLAVQMFYGRPAYHSTVELSVYVAAEYRQRGVGKALVSHLIEKSPKLGIKTLLAIAFAENQPSVSLLKGFGFEQWGYLPQVGGFDQEERDVVILGRKV